MVFPVINLCLQYSILVAIFLLQLTNTKLVLSSISIIYLILYLSTGDKETDISNADDNDKSLNVTVFCIYMLATNTESID